MRRIIRVILALSASVGLLAGSAPAALADGDPASDVLVFQPAFEPPDSGASLEQDARLTATVRAADRAGYPIRVALIASAGDLGTVTQLWEEPLDYAVYLRKELSYQFHGVLLTVMPQGYGLVVPQKTPPPQDDLMNREVAPGTDLALGAQRVVVALARANGVALSIGAVPLPRGAGGGSSALAPIGFGVGLVAIVVAWAASLRARPLRRRALA